MSDLRTLVILHDDHHTLAVRRLSMKVCQLFLGQAQLKAASVDSLQRAVPDISDDDIAAMQDCPFRGFDSEILKEPNVYRTYEAITHYGEAIKMLINEVTTARLLVLAFVFLPGASLKQIPPCYHIPGMRRRDHERYRLLPRRWHHGG